MPIDASIPLQVKDQPLVSPLQSIGQIMQLRNSVAELQQRQALAEQERQNAANLKAKAEQENRDLADSNTIQAKMRDPVTGPQIMKNDLSSLNGIIQPHIQIALADKLDAHIKNLAANTAETLKNRVEGQRQVGEAAQTLLDLGDINKINQAIPSVTAGLNSSGAFKAAGLDPSTVPQHIESIDQLKDWMHGANITRAGTEAALKLKGEQQKIDTEAATQKKTEADTAKTQGEVAGTIPISQDQAAKLQIEQIAAERAAAAQAETARHNKIDEAQGAGRLGVSQQEQNLKNKTFQATFGSGLDANGQPLSPEALKVAAQQDPDAVAIANYQLAPPSSRTTPIGLAMMRKVLAINPTYDATSYAGRNKTAQDFSASGASGKAITSADTALAHLDTISKAGAALKSGDITQLNRLANFVGAQTGSAAPTVYDSIISTVAPEISKAVIGGPGGEGDREKMAANFGRNLSDAQREGAVGANVGLLAARVNKMKDAYESTMGRPLTRQLSPESQSVLQRYQGGGATGAPSGMIRARDPQGKLHEAPKGTALPVGWKLEP